MKKLEVRYCGWGEDWPLGTLAETRDQLLFEYSPEALAQGLELSPYSLRLGPQTFAGFPGFQQRLPGLIADALPDGWGMLLKSVAVFHSVLRGAQWHVVNIQRRRNASHTASPCAV